MKKFLLSVFCVAGLMATQSVNAQTFTTQSDTAVYVYNNIGNTSYPVYNKIKANPAGDSIEVNWKVISTTFPADWLVDTVFGMCDNNLCRQGQFAWNGTPGSPFISNWYYNDSNNDFHLLLNLYYTQSVGTYYMTVHLENASNASNAKDIVFKVTKGNVGVANINKADNNISLYPNPASNELNLVYSPQSGVSTISVYNLIGKVMRVYKPVDNSSAQLNISDMPAGIYFVRLQNAQGAIIGTRKFTRE